MKNFSERNTIGLRTALVFAVALILSPLAVQADAPVLDNSQSPTLSAIAEDSASSTNAGTAVADIIVPGSITDPDGPAVAAIAVTAADNANGIWQYSTDDGATWTAFGSLSDASALLLDGTLTDASRQKIRFVPDTNYFGSATITFRAWDLSSGSAGATVDTTANGGATAFSAETDTASITVTAVNDAPTLSGYGALDSASIATPNGLEGASSVFAPKVAIAGNGLRYVVAWTDMPNTSTVAVKAQLFDHAGEPLTSVITVTSSDLTFSVTRPIEIDVAMDSAGRFVVVYDTLPDAGSFEDVAFQRYEADGTPLGSRVTVGLSTRLESAPTISLSESGRIVVGYNQANPVNATHRYVYTLYASFENVGTFSTTSIASTGKTTPEVSFNANGNLLVGGALLNGASSRIPFRHVTSTGSLSLATTVLFSIPVAPVFVNVENSSNWRLIYLDATSGTTNLIMQNVSPGATTSTAPVTNSPMVLATNVSDRVRPSGVADVDGILTVAFAVPGDNGAIISRIARFDASGAAVGEPLQISTQTPAAFQLSGGGDLGQSIGAVFSRQTSASAGANTAAAFSLDLLLSSPAVALRDTPSADAFAAQVGRLFGYDVEASPLAFALADSTSGGVVDGVIYSLSKSNTLGVLYLSDVDGKYAFVPNGAAIDALSSNATNSFTLSVSDGELTASLEFVVSIAATNDNPAAGSDSFTRPAGPFKISVASLLSNDADAESDSFALTSFDATTSDGGSVTRAGPWLLFTPNTALVDTFSYTITDSHGAFATGAVTVTLGDADSSQTKNILNIATDGADKVIEFAGVPGAAYAVQYTDSLAGTPVWTTLSTETAGANGLFTFRDVAPGGASRFYRAVVP